jgi:hypothetical protein
MLDVLTNVLEEPTVSIFKVEVAHSDKDPKDGVRRFLQC